MHPIPRKQEKPLIVVVADLARRRKDRGVRLNHPEAVACIAAEIFERAREGRMVTGLMVYGTVPLAYDGVMEGVLEMIRVVQVETTFLDGIKLVSVHDPICRRLP